MTGERIKYLEEGFLEGSLSDSEEQELRSWVQKHPEHHLAAYFAWTARELPDDMPDFKQKVNLSDRPKSWNWIKVAAAVLVLCTAGFLLKDKLKSSQENKEYTETEIDESYKATIETLSAMAVFLDKSLADAQKCIDLSSPFEQLNELKDQKPN